MQVVALLLCSPPQLPREAISCVSISSDPQPQSASVACDSAALWHCLAVCAVQFDDLCRDRNPSSAGHRTGRTAA